MSYGRARALTLVAGLAILLLLSAFQLSRGVDNVEVAGTSLLFIPVFIGFVFGDVVGGLIGAVVAGLAYALLKSSAISAVGTENYLSIMGPRWISYLAFGLIGGWANKQMRGSLEKLELYDQIDDSTGIYNARFFLQDTDLELSRANRYQSIFSIVVVDVPVASISSLGRRQRQALLKDLGRILKESVRTVDRPVHGASRESHRFAVVLPETGREGVVVFGQRLADKVHEFLAKKGLGIERTQIAHLTLTLPDDEAELAALRDQFAEIDRAEHPEENAAAGQG